MYSSSFCFNIWLVEKVLGIYVKNILLLLLENSFIGNFNRCTVRKSMYSESSIIKFAVTRNVSVNLWTCHLTAIGRRKINASTRTFYKELYWIVAVPVNLSISFFIFYYQCKVAENITRIVTLRKRSKRHWSKLDTKSSIRKKNGEHVEEKMVIWNITL